MCIGYISNTLIDVDVDGKCLQTRPSDLIELRNVMVNHIANRWTSKVQVEWRCEIPRKLFIFISLKSIDSMQFLSIGGYFEFSSGAEGGE